MTAQQPQDEITVTRTKESVTSKVGLRLNLDDSNRLVVTRMSPDSLFANSELALGMQILTINGLDCTEDMSAEEATGLIKRIKGAVTLTATAPPEEEEEEEDPEPVIVTRVKETTSSKIGLRLGVAAGKLIVTKIGDDSLFANSELEAGMTVLSINGLQLDDAGFSAEDATNLIRRVKGKLTIEAQHQGGDSAPPPPPSGTPTRMDDNASTGTGGSGRYSTQSAESGGSGSSRRATITVNKSSPEQKVGLSLAQTGQGMMITRVDPAGLFGNRIQPNTKLISVNNVNVKKLPVPLVRNMIGRVAGELTLVIESEDNHNNSRGGGGGGGVYVPPSAQQRQQELNATVIEVVDTEIMMGHHNPPGEVVVARPPSQRQEQAMASNNNVPIEARAYRESARTKVGIRLKCRTNGMVLIEHVAPDGLFQHSRLRAGMRLQSVNGVPVTGKPHAQVVQMIGSTVGEMRLVAMNL